MSSPENLLQDVIGGLNADEQGQLEKTPLTSKEITAIRSGVQKAVQYLTERGAAADTRAITCSQIRKVLQEREAEQRMKKLAQLWDEKIIPAFQQLCCKTSNTELSPIDVFLQKMAIGTLEDIVRNLLRVIEQIQSQDIAVGDEVILMTPFKGKDQHPVRYYFRGLTTRGADHEILDVLLERKDKKDKKDKNIRCGLFLLDNNVFKTMEEAKTAHPDCDFSTVESEEQNKKTLKNYKI